ncbi:MAG TPA: non-ribosomal peptide synthetase, partial [Pyrinomonadaceae bacterium]
SALTMLGAGERRQLLEEFNETRREYPRDVTLGEMFERQVSLTPEGVALVAGEEELTYAELNARAEALAWQLRELGVGAESLVGVCAERTPEMVIALLGVFKAGGAYLPLDPAYPAERLSYMLEDAGVRVLLTQRRLAETLHPRGTEVVYLDEPRRRDAASDNRQPATTATRMARPENLAYVIYTSGSTGRPKGVAVTHRSLVNYICWSQDVYQHDSAGSAAPSDCALYSSLAFDLTVTSLFLPLVSGHTLHLYPRQEGATSLLEVMADNRAHLLKLTPSHLSLIRELDNRNSLVRCLIVGGEALSTELAQAVSRSFGHRVDIYNEYGPTEATVGCMIYRFDPEDAERAWVPIGRPAANTQIYVLDEHLRPVAFNVAGDLYIGGDGLARGYLNRAELTAERFIPDPHSSQMGARMYRTGDVARWRVSGELEFLGRSDEQVKVRGFRIELGEVEAAVCDVEGVRQCVAVVLEEASGDKRLVAYVVAAEGAHAPASSELRASLRERLPEYMIPSAIVALDELPLTPNGKVDRSALPELDGLRPELESRYEKPRTGLERLLVEMWEDVLGVETVGVYDNFFDLGGTSIRVVVFVKRLQQRLGVPVSVKDLFGAPNVAALAAHLNDHYGHAISAVGVDDDGDAPSLLNALQPAAGSWSPLVEFQHGAGKTPLFFVHPVGGNVFCYFNLSRRLGADQPFYALQSRGLSDEQHGHTRIEEMASYYIEHLRAVQPAGPYRIGGWSLGGVVAFEMARQLKAGGDEVVMLALIDSLSPRTLAGMEPDDELSQLANFALDLGFTMEHLSRSRDVVRQLPLEGQLAYMLELALSERLVPAGMELSHLHRLFSVFKTNQEAMRAYVPDVYEGQVTYFKAVGDGTNGAGDMSQGWRELALGGVEVHRLPGDHYSILKQPYVDALAERIEQQLQKIENGDGAAN